MGRSNKKPKTAKTYRVETRQLLKSFKGKNLSEIHPFLIEKHKQSRIQADAKVSANRELTCLKSIFNRCIEWRKFQGENPARAVKLVKEPKNKVRFLSNDEEKRLLEAASEPLRTILLVGIYTGLRLAGEALRLKWQDVDLQRGTLTVQASYAKNGETRNIPLSRALRDALAQLKQRAPSGSEFVFLSQRGMPFRNIRTAFTTACRHANLPAVSPHVLRHTFASRLQWLEWMSEQFKSWAAGKKSRWLNGTHTFPNSTSLRLSRRFPARISLRYSLHSTGSPP